MNLGAIIQRRRTELGMSQEKLAEAVGVSRQAVSKWELGDAVPDTDKLPALSRTLGITVDQLLGCEGEVASPPTEPERSPSWLATHWYWIGLVPLAWGAVRLIWMLVVLVTFMGLGSGLPQSGSFW